MFDKIVRAHAWSSRGLAFTVAMLMIWVAALCFVVIETALGRPRALACLIAAGLVVREPLHIALAALTASRSLEKRAARIRALAALRVSRLGRGGN